MQSRLDSNAATPAIRHIDWSACALTVAVVLAFALALCPDTTDSDLWGHVYYGHEWLASGELPTTATYTFAARDQRWINHEMLAKLVLSAGMQHLGASWLLAIKCLAGLMVIGLMTRHAVQRGAQPLIGAAFLLLVAVSLTPFWALRPQVFSYIYLAVMLALLNRAFYHWSEETRVELRWLLPVPVMFIAWANSHGAFVAGLCLLLGYLGGRSLEAICRLRYEAEKHVFSFGCIALASVGGTLLNPYGKELWSWMLTNWNQPHPEISEWIPSAPSHEFFIPFVLLAILSLVAWCFTQRRRDWVHLSLIALCLWQSYSDSRHIALLAILVGFWVPSHFQSALDRVLPRNRRQTAGPQWQTWVIVGVFAAASLLLSVRLHARFAATEVRRADYPGAALQFMRDHQVRGKLVVGSEWAQFAIVALSPDVEVTCDGRFRASYPQRVTDMHLGLQNGDNEGNRFRSENSRDVNGHRVLDYKQPDLVLVDRRFSHGAAVMASQDTFILLYQDELAQVWGRGAKFDDPDGVAYVPPARRDISSGNQTGGEAWPAFPQR